MWVLTTTTGKKKTGNSCRHELAEGLNGSHVGGRMWMGWPALFYFLFIFYVCNWIHRPANLIRFSSYKLLKAFIFTRWLLNGWFHCRLSLIKSTCQLSTVLIFKCITFEVLEHTVALCTLYCFARHSCQSTVISYLVCVFHALNKLLN